ncbi:MAG TPA: hypothetical protein VFM75_07230 [Modicisalibacter sp.]|nr:hypothetical protein [Modicisalibacter sp.]
MSGVNRYISTHILPGAGDWNSSVAPHTYVHAADYDRLEQECDSVAGKLRTALLDKAQIEAERDAALKQVEALRDLLLGVMHEVGPMELGIDLCGRIDAALQAKP